VAIIYSADCQFLSPTFRIFFWRSGSQTVFSFSLSLQFLWWGLFGFFMFECPSDDEMEFGGNRGWFTGDCLVIWWSRKGFFERD
jgi:hypothetical protein